MNNVSAIKRQSMTFSVRGITHIGVLSAIAIILRLFDFPLWFAPGFYKLDISIVPSLIGGFTIGPLAGVLIEFIKNLLNLVLNGTTTQGLGELSNFLIGCFMVLPSAVIYRYNKTEKNVFIGLIAGIVCLTLGASLLNAYVLLPVYSKAFHMPMDALIAMGTKLNPLITDFKTFVLYAVAPFNLVKGLLNSAVTFLIYKLAGPALRRI